ncbi:MAG: type II toxin-antitoxin system PemK/MazF family toxin [Bacteroidaceae bacterium]|nr:type II toxin-antitoxin system PemK/MazF family toxin [Bacteroidaceae bacterium]
MIKRGEVYYILKEDSQNSGCEMRSSRPAIVVSNDKANLHSPVIEVVYLTTQEKKDLPTHVAINSTGRRSTALCEQIHSVSVDRVSDCLGVCTDSEMQMIDIALAVSVGINFGEPLEAVLEQTNDDVDVVRVIAERDTYKTMYEHLLSKVIGGYNG